MRVPRFLIHRGRVFRRILRINLILCLCAITILSALFLSSLVEVARDNDDARAENALAAGAAHFNLLANYARDAVTAMENSEWMYYDLFIRHVVTGEKLTLAVKTSVRDTLSVLCRKRSDIAWISFMFDREPDTLYTNLGVFEHIGELRELFPDKPEYHFFDLGGEAAGLAGVTCGDETYLCYRDYFSDTDATPPKGQMNVVFKTGRLTSSIAGLLDGTASSFTVTNGDAPAWRVDLSFSDEKKTTISKAYGAYEYAIEVPISVSHATARAMGPRVLFAIALDLLCVLALSFLLTGRWYRNLARVLDLYVHDLNRGDDEIESLSETLEDITSSRDQALSAQGILLPLGQQRILHGLLTGSGVTYEPDVMAACGLRFAAPKYNVLAFGLAAGSDGAADARAVADIGVKALSRVAGLTPCAAYFYDGDGRGFFLINGEEEDIEPCADALSRAAAEAGAPGASLRFGLGLTQGALTSAYHAADQAAAALDHSLLCGGKGGIERYRDIASRSSFRYYFPFAEQARLAALLEEGQRDGARELADYIIETNDHGDENSAQCLATLASDLYSTLLRSAVSVGSDDLGYGPGDIHTFAQLRRETAAAIDRLCDAADAGRAEGYSQRRLEAEILAFIEENLYHPFLSLDYVARHFDKSTAYISTTFKKAMGVNYVDYVNRSRVLKAAELLRGGGQRVAEVSAAVGYVNVTTFRRNFIRYMGKLPAEYFD